MYPLHGQGFVSAVKRVVGNTKRRFSETTRRASNAAQGPKVGYSKPAQLVLDYYGNELITGLFIDRKKVDEGLNTALNAFSGNQWNAAREKEGLSSIFHVSLRASLDSGRVIRIEKLAVITLTNINTSNQTDGIDSSQPVPNPPRKTLSEFMAAAESTIPPETFFLYDAFDNNCQDFVANLLRSNDCLDAGSYSFLKQDVSGVVAAQPGYLQSIARTATDLGGMADRFINGGGLGDMAVGAASSLAKSYGVDTSVEAQLRNAQAGSSRDSSKMTALDHANDILHPILNRMAGPTTPIGIGATVLDKGLQTANQIDHLYHPEEPVQKPTGNPYLQPTNNADDVLRQLKAFFQSPGMSALSGHGMPLKGSGRFGLLKHVTRPSSTGEFRMTPQREEEIKARMLHKQIRDEHSRVSQQLQHFRDATGLHELAELYEPGITYNTVLGACRDTTEPIDAKIRMHDGEYVPAPQLYQDLRFPGGETSRQGRLNAQQADVEGQFHRGDPTNPKDRLTHGAGIVGGVLPDYNLSQDHLPPPAEDIGEAMATEGSQFKTGKIYKISSTRGKKAYIGSTFYDLKDKFRMHKNHYASYKNGKMHYVSSFDVLKYPDARITLLETYPCRSKRSLEVAEGRWQRKSYPGYTLVNRFRAAEHAGKGLPRLHAHPFHSLHTPPISKDTGEGVLGVGADGAVFGNPPLPFKTKRLPSGQFVTKITSRKAARQERQIGEHLLKRDPEMKYTAPAVRKHRVTSELLQDPQIANMNTTRLFSDRWKAIKKERILASRLVDGATRADTFDNEWRKGKLNEDEQKERLLAGAELTKFVLSKLHTTDPAMGPRIEHSDAHANNVMWDRANKKYVLLDYGRAVINPRHESLNDLEQLTRQTAYELLHSKWKDDTDVQEYIKSAVNAKTRPEYEFLAQDLEILLESLHPTTSVGGIPSSVATGKRRRSVSPPPPSALAAVTELPIAPVESTLTVDFLTPSPSDGWKTALPREYRGKYNDFMALHRYKEDRGLTPPNPSLVGVGEGDVDLRFEPDIRDLVNEDQANAIKAGRWQEIQELKREHALRYPRAAAQWRINWQRGQLGSIEDAFLGRYNLNNNFRMQRELHEYLQGIDTPPWSPEDVDGSGFRPGDTSTAESKQNPATQKAVAEALSGDQVRKDSGQHISVIRYPDLSKYKTWDDFMSATPARAAAVLFLVESETSGHWVAAFDGPDGPHIFDPLGIAMDMERNRISHQERKEFGEEEPQFARLLKTQGKPVHVSRVDYQTDKPGINTCGRWTALRIRWKHMSDEQWCDKVHEAVSESGLSPDAWIATEGALSGSGLKEGSAILAGILRSGEEEEQPIKRTPLAVSEPPKEKKHPKKKDALMGGSTQQGHFFSENCKRLRMQIIDDFVNKKAVKKGVLQH